MNQKIILSNECEKCIYGIIDERNKAKIIVHCKLKNKNYFYGQRIPCDHKRSSRS